MLEPAEVSLSCFIGSDLVDCYSFFEDEAQQQPYDFTGWTSFTMVIGTIELTDSDGLTVDATAGTISPFLTRATTSQLRTDVTRYTLSGIDPLGNLGYLMVGKFQWLDPMA